MSTDFNELHKKLKIEHKRLEEELELLHNSASSSDERREGSPFGKREEEATETLELEKRLTMENRIRQDLVGVEHALRKFEEGTYGKCHECGKQIQIPRLKAVPHARLCIQCKSAEEERKAGKERR